MKYLLDACVLMDAEREKFNPETFFAADDEIFICGATVAEFLSGEPVKDEGKRRRFQKFWDGLDLPVLPLTPHVCEQAGALLYFARCKGWTVDLGDGLHAAVAEDKGLRVLTTNTKHFEAMDVDCVAPN